MAAANTIIFIYSQNVVTDNFKINYDSRHSKVAPIQDIQKYFQFKTFKSSSNSRHSKVQVAPIQDIQK